ncbi:MAG TPA: histidine phosphatase family protein [Bacillota bacterium]|nr:histidine phosphatase family protein [Bacillota bacterium]
MDTHLYLVRHGTTEWNELKRYQGHRDLPLSDAGKLQAERCAMRLRTADIAAVYSSDLTRAMDTAYSIAKAHELPVIPQEALREIDVGKWEGKSFEEIRSRSRELLEPWLQDTVNNPIPGGESYAQLRDRVIPKAMELISTHIGSSICIVSHSGPLKLILCHALGIEPSGRLRFELTNGSVSAITCFDDIRMRVSFLNDTCHLAT